VWLAKNVMGTHRAVKVVYRRTFEHERPYEREFRGIQKFEPVSRTHDGLVDILQVGRNDEARYFYYVMELADDVTTGQQIDPATYEQKTLADTVADHKALSVEDCLQLGLSIASAVSHLHKHSLIHRDIKPSNIIIVNGVPKLADIGLVTDTATPSIPGGTLGYIAPEGIPSPQADIYSLGKVLYEISTGKDRQEYPELPEHWGDGTATEKRYEINEVILKACQTDRSQRYQTADELSADLVLLQAGKSVKRLRLLERRLAILAKVGVAMAVLGLVAAGAYYQTYRETKLKTRQLAESYVAYGTRSMDEGNLFDSLPSFADALRLDQNDSRRTETHRIRIASVLRQCPRILQMSFHNGGINHTEFSPDGQQVLIAGFNGIASIWDPWRGKRPVQLELTNEVRAASFSPDGRLAVTAGVDKSARIWSVPTGEQLLPLPHSRTVHFARFGPDGRQVVTASGNTVRFWEAKTGELLDAFTEHTDSVRSVSFSPNGQLIVTASEDGTALVWECAMKRVVFRLRHLPGRESASWITYASFSPDGRYVATAGLDRSARVWSADTGQPVRVFEHEGGVESAEFSPDGRYVITACGDFSARVWDIATGKEAIPRLKHNSYVKHASFSADGRRIVTGTALGVVCLWDIAAHLWSRPLTPIFFSGDGDCSATISNNVARVNKATGREMTPLPMSGHLCDLKFNQAGSRLLAVLLRENPTIGPSTMVQLWDVTHATPLAEPFSYSNQITAVREDAERMLTVRSNLAQLWDTLSGKTLFSPLEHEARIIEASFSLDGSKIVTVSGTEASIWDANRGTRLSICPHPCEVTHAEFSPNGRWLVTSCADLDTTPYAAQIWDASTGRPIGKPLAHGDGVRHASFSPDSRRVVTSGEDRTAIIWDVETGLRIRRLIHEHGVYEASFSADSRWVLTVSSGESARVWDAETGAPITPPLRHDWRLWHARFIDHGQRILTKRLKGDYWMRWERAREPVVWEWRIWDFSQDTRPLEDLVLLAQLLSGHQSDDSGGTMPLGNEALRQRWETLRAKYPQDFTPSAGDDMVAWHQREAAASEKAHQWFGARFHLDRLLALKPNEPSLLQRRTRAAEELNRLALRSN